MNDYVSAKQKYIPAMLIYARHKDKVLMMERGKKTGDIHATKWNGLGGKFERGEDLFEATSREFFEEAGVRIEPSRFKVLGHLHFPNFKASANEDWGVSVCTVELFESELPQIISESPEGRLSWIPSDQILELNLWQGDRLFLPKVIQNEAFMGTFFYENGELTRHWLQNLGTASAS